MTERTTERRHSRRHAIGATMVAVTLSGGLLAACGSSTRNRSSAGNSPSTQSSSAQGASTQGSTSSGSVGPTDKTLKLGIGSDIESLDPDLIKAGTDFYYANNVFEQLIMRDPNGKQVPGLATSWSVSPDGKTITFQLRQGVTFQDGEPMTAADVVYSFNRFVDPSLNNVFAYELADMQSVSAQGSNTVVVQLKTPDGSFIPAGGYVPIVPMHYIQQHGSAYFNQHPIGTGPYTFTSRLIGQSFTLTRYDGYWGSKPYYKTLQFSIIPDDNSRIAALQSGQIQFAAQVPPQRASQLKSDSNLTVETGYTGDNIFLDINTKEKNVPWDNPQVRQAMSYAIDRQALIKNILFGEGEPLVGLAPNDAGYSGTSLTEKPYDPAKAKQLLAQAGYAKGFSLDFWAPVDGRLPASSEMTQAIIGYWANVGIKATPHIVSYDQWVQSESSKSNINGVVFGLWGDSSFDPQQRMAGSMACTGAYSHNCDPTLDAMITKVESTVDPTARQQAIEAAFSYALQNEEQIYLYSADGAFAMDKNIHWQPWKAQPYTKMSNAYGS